jgi:hypothetical protein
MELELLPWYFVTSPEMWEPKTNNEGDSMIVQPFASHEALIYQARGVQEDIQKDSSQAAHLMSDHEFCEWLEHQSTTSSGWRLAKRLGTMKTGQQDRCRMPWSMTLIRRFAAYGDSGRI